MRRILLSIALLATQISLVFGQSSIGSEIAPGGKMRVGMIAITVLGGVADPVAKFIGSKLGLPVDIVMYPNPEAYAQSFGKGEWDIAIGPRALAPEEKADSTADLWIISLVYIAAPGREYAHISAVDRPGVKIGTITGAPSDRILTRVASDMAHWRFVVAEIADALPFENPAKKELLELIGKQEG